MPTPPQVGPLHPQAVDVDPPAAHRPGGEQAHLTDRLNVREHKLSQRVFVQVVEDRELVLGGHDPDVLERVVAGQLHTLRPEPKLASPQLDPWSEPGHGHSRDGSYDFDPGVLL